MRLTPSLLLLLAAPVAACGGSADAPPGERAAAPAETPAPDPAGPDTLVVELDEYGIGLPDTLPAGRHVLRVRNAGFEEHDLELRLGERTWSLGTELNPGASRVFDVELEPGSYRVLCTVSGHDGRGMSMELTVVAARGG